MEGDVANVMKSFGVTQKAAVELQKVYHGQGYLSPDMAYSLISRVNSNYDIATSSYKNNLDIYKNTAKQMNLPDTSVIDVSAVKAQDTLEKQIMPQLPLAEQNNIQAALGAGKNPISIYNMALKRLEQLNQQQQQQAQQQEQMQQQGMGDPNAQ